MEFELPLPETPGAVGMVPDLRHAMFKPSKNLPAIDSAGINLPYAVMVSISHLSCTSNHHFWDEWMQSAVQRPVTFSVVQR